MQSKERRLGRLRRRQHQPVPQPAAVLRLRRGHRPAVRRRHRARGGDARRRGTRARPAHPPRHRMAAGRTGAQRRLVRPLGRQLRLRHRLGGPRPGRGRAARLAPGDPPGGRLAGVASRTTDGGWGEDLRSYDDAPEWIGRGSSTASQTGWALLALLAAGERESKAVERGIALARRDPAARRLLGRALLHRDRLPVGLLHQLPPLPPGLPADRARPLRQRRARPGRREAG